MIHAVIMAGGLGKRLWPYSRKALPKQFLAVSKKESFLQATIIRVLPFVFEHNIWIIGNEQHKDLLAKQTQNYPKIKILYEPENKNTAACIAWVISQINKIDKDANIAILPSDHWISNNKNFQTCIKKGLTYTKKQPHLLTIGITPMFPNTEYGYIEIEKTQDTIKKVRNFHEKPSQEIAIQYIEAKSYFWNAGIFIGHIQTLKNAYKHYLPEYYKLILELEKVDSNSKIDLHAIYKKFTPLSFDYGIMEKSEAITRLIPATFQWSDIGNWESLEKVHQKDNDNNIILSDHHIKDASNNIIITQNKETILIDIDNLIVIDSDDLLFIGSRNSTKKIQELRKQLPKKLQ